MQTIMDDEGLAVVEWCLSCGLLTTKAEEEVMIEEMGDGRAHLRSL